MPKFLKPLLLLGLAFFLYTRLADGTILFYINQRFVWLIWIGVGMLVLIALSYGMGKNSAAHSHELSWATAALVLVPIVLGLQLSPQPLSSAALLNRDPLASAPAIDYTQYQLVADPQQLTSDTGEDILQDWVLAVSAHPDPAVFVGKSADLIGFIHFDSNLPADTWLLNRFLIWCCVADATQMNLIIHAPEVQVENDMWVQVRGHFAAETINGTLRPVLIAEEVIPIEMPAQPYLYPVRRN